MIPGTENMHIVEPWKNNFTFHSKVQQEDKDLSRGCPEDVQRISKGYPVDVQRRASRGVQRGSPEEGLGMYSNAYISMSRNHNDSDLKCYCADR